MRTEISQAKKETAHYLTSVEKQKEISAIVERKKRKGLTVEEVRPVITEYLKRGVCNVCVC